MQTPLQITFRNIGASPAIEADIRKRVARLERFHDRITGCRVVIDARHRTHHKGTLYNCAIELAVPGKAVAVNRVGPLDHAHEDVYVAIRDAFDAAARRLEDHARRIRSDVKTHEPPPHGRVVRLFPDQDYGFIALPDGQEVYFHRNSVTGGGYDALTAGSEVRLVVAENESEKGPQASTVTLVGKHHIVG